jgi:hypothetical protein
MQKIRELVTTPLVSHPRPLPLDLHFHHHLHRPLSRLSMNRHDLKFAQEIYVSIRWIPFFRKRKQKDFYRTKGFQQEKIYFKCLSSLNINVN